MSDTYTLDLLKDFFEASALLAAQIDSSRSWVAAGRLPTRREMYDHRKNLLALAETANLIAPLCEKGQK